MDGTAITSAAFSRQHKLSLAAPIAHTPCWKVSKREQRYAKSFLVNQHIANFDRSAECDV